MKTITRRINGETFGFLEETALLYDIQPEKVPESRYKEALDMIDKALAGTGPLATRLEGFRKQLSIPQDKVFELFSKAAEIARNKVQSILPMPGSETFDPELVNDKPWSGYNWFIGKSHSLIQLNVDLPRRVDRLIPLMRHEGYPGHRTELTMREKLLYQDKGYLEYSIYPLYSPMSVISEGYADLGAEILFSDKETVDFMKDVLSNELHVYDFDIVKWNILRSALSDFRSVWGNVATLLLEENKTDDEVLEYIRQYGLVDEEYARKRIDFIKTYRGYIFNYHYGYYLLKDYYAGKNMVSELQTFLSEPAYPSKFSK